MAKLEDLKRGAAVKGILADCLVTVVDVKWYGAAAIELTYKDPAGKPGVVLLYRDREPSLEIVEAGRLLFIASPTVASSSSLDLSLPTIAAPRWRPAKCARSMRRLARRASEIDPVVALRHE